MGCPKKRTLGLIGYGAFGRLIHPYLERDFDVRVYDRTPSNDLTINFAPMDKVASSDVIVIATPVHAIEEIARDIVPHILPHALVIDVGSTKGTPARVLSQVLPQNVDILCTHPLFGPKSDLDGSTSQKVVLCPIRGNRLPIVRRWITDLAFEVLVASPDEHDQNMAVVQGVTHLVSRILRSLDSVPTDMTTPSFGLLMKSSDMVGSDSPAVLSAIHIDNPYASDVMQQFFKKVDELREQFEKDKCQHRDGLGRDALREHAQ
ncbi:MAG: prephenate dehydrogenase [Pseudoruegeria sp.]